MDGSHRLEERIMIHKVRSMAVSSGYPPVATDNTQVCITPFDSTCSHQQGYVRLIHFTYGCSYAEINHSY